MHHSWCKKSGSDLWSVLQVGVSLKMTSVMNFVFGYIPLLKKFLLITNNPQNSFLIFIPYSFLSENFYQYISFQIYVFFNSGNSFLTQYFTAENMMEKIRSQSWNKFYIQCQNIEYPQFSSHESTFIFHWNWYTCSCQAYEFFKL